MAGASLRIHWTRPWRKIVAMASSSGPSPSRCGTSAQTGAGTQPGGEPIAARRLVERLDGKRRRAAQRQGQLEERHRAALLQLQLDLGQRLLAAVGLEPAHVDIDLDLRRAALADGPVHQHALALHPARRRRARAPRGERGRCAPAPWGRRRPADRAFRPASSTSHSGLSCAAPSPSLAAFRV